MQEMVNPQLLYSVSNLLDWFVVHCGPVELKEAGIDILQDVR